MYKINSVRLGSIMPHEHVRGVDRMLSIINYMDPKT